VGYCTTSDVLAWINGTGQNTPAADPVVDRLVDAASEVIRSYCNRDIDSKAYPETRNGNGGTALMLSQYPVTAVASVTVDGVTIPARPTVTSSGWVLDTLTDYGPGIVRLDGYSFSKGVQNVVVNYTAGYASDSIPADIIQACVEIAADMKRRGPRVGEVSKNLQGQVVAYSQKDIPAQVKMILDQFRRVAPI
jgi:hypothetical protein